MRIFRYRDRGFVFIIICFLGLAHLIIQNTLLFENQERRVKPLFKKFTNRAQITFLVNLPQKDA